MNDLLHSAIFHGDCSQIMKTLPAESVDFVLTDPPYLVNYIDRRGRAIANDQTHKTIKEVWRQVARLLKTDALCFSFYGWQHIDAFSSAWDMAGLRRVGHVVLPKRYASSQGYVRYSHECGYLLAKGSPPVPERPIPDVLEWHYSGNRRHPTEKSVETLKPIIEAFTKVGDIILDPYAGSGSSLVATALMKRRYIGIEIERQYCESARRRLEGVQRHVERQLTS